MSYTGSSCINIHDNHPETRIKSGYYCTNNTEWTYCNMTEFHDIPTTCVGRGWKRIAKVDISAGDNCPCGWNKGNYSGYGFCQKSFDGAGCSSTIFSTKGITYQRVCGKARGYQKGLPNDGLAFNSLTIDDHYVNGLSITYGSPRQHIWFYANGDHDTSETYYLGCPCDGLVGYNPWSSSFVDSNYYCESS